MSSEKYYNIVRHYESCLDKHGDNHLGVDWPKAEDVEKRYEVMLDVIKYSPNISAHPVRLLDFGCGAGHLYEYLVKSHSQVSYSGLDISQKFIHLCQQKFPNVNFTCVDILKERLNKKYDYVIMNGVFTEKKEMSFDEMFLFFSDMVMKVLSIADKGVAFNVMTKHVDWEREDLFHLPFDKLASFLKNKVSRNFIIRNDYGLYEYTVYIYR